MYKKKKRNYDVGNVKYFKSKTLVENFLSRDLSKNIRFIHNAKYIIEITLHAIFMNYGYHGHFKAETKFLNHLYLLKKKLFA